LTRARPLPYTERVAGKGAALFTFLLVLVAPPVSLAEHEVYYRYTVLGYVGDETGRLRPKVEIITARFDPADHVQERGTRVDFVRGRRVETPGAFAATLQRFLAR
jgi:hypothetical protein